MTSGSDRQRVYEAHLLYTSQIAYRGKKKNIFEEKSGNLPKSSAKPENPRNGVSGDDATTP